MKEQVTLGAAKRENQKNNIYSLYKNVEEQTQKKYTSRPLPPYPAKNCSSKKMRGNDGKMYMVIKYKKNKTFKWVPFKTYNKLYGDDIY